MIRFCSVFLAVMLFAATAWAQPVNTYAIEGSQGILSQMSWLPDPHKDVDYASASSPETQGRYLPLTTGFGLQDTGPGWLRLELAKNDQQTSTAPTRVDKKSLYLNFNFLPSGKATLYKTGSFSSHPSTRHQPLATRVYPFQVERLAEPSISNAVYYIQLEETPGLWFNPTLSRTDSKSPILPHDLLLPSILLACLAFSLLRLAIDRTAWPVWAAAILVCVITELLLSIPVSTKILHYSNLPVIMAPGIAVMIYAHLGRLLLHSPTTFPKADAFLKFYPLVGALAALAPLVPQLYWITRLFPLWGLLLVPLLVVATNALFRQLKGSFAYFVATFMPVLGAAIALYGIFTPSIDMLAETGTFWGVAIGSFALIFARAAHPSKDEEETEHNEERTQTPSPWTEQGVIGSESTNEAGLDIAFAQNDKVAPLLVSPLAMGGEPNDIFTSLQYADLSGTLSTPEAFADPKEPEAKNQPAPPQGEGTAEEPSQSFGLEAEQNTKEANPQESETPQPEPSLPQTSVISDADAQALVDELRLDNSHVSPGAPPLSARSNAQEELDSPKGKDDKKQSDKEQRDKAQNARIEDANELGDDILDLDTLAEPSFLTDIAPHATQAKGIQKTRASQRREQKKSSTLDWPVPEEAPRLPSQPSTTASAELSAPFGGSPLATEKEIPSPIFLDSTAENLINETADFAAPPALAPQAEFTELFDAPSQPQETEEKKISSAQSQATPSALPSLDSFYTDFQMDAPQGGEADAPSSTDIIRLTDESLEDSIPESATRKVDAMLASLDGFNTSSKGKQKADKSIADSTEGVDTLDNVDSHNSQDSLDSPSAAVATDATDTLDILDALNNSVSEEHQDLNASLTMTENGAAQTTSPAMPPESMEETPPVTERVDADLAEITEVTEKTVEIDDADEPESQKAETTALPAESLPAQHLSHPRTITVNQAPSAALPKDTQAVRERAYIEALLSTEDKPSSFDDEPAPLSPLVARYLQSHSEKEQEVLESYGGHCIIITEMTTSNKRLLRSYFNEVGIPCVEAKNFEDTTTIQAITGSPLIIYDADSPADAIIQSIGQLKQAAKPPKHLVLTSVPSQGKQLVEQGATLAVTKPFTKDSLFTAAQSAAPDLFPHNPSFENEGNIPSSSGRITGLATGLVTERVAKTTGTPSDTTSGQSSSSGSFGSAGSSAPKQHSPVNGANLSYAEEAYIEELFGGHRQTKDEHTKAPSGAEKITEQRVDDLLAQLNGGGAPSRSGNQTAEDQTASAISKMLSVDVHNSAQTPYGTYVSGPATPPVSPSVAPASSASLPPHSEAPSQDQEESRAASQAMASKTASPSFHPNDTKDTQNTNGPSEKETSGPKIKDSLLDFIVADDEGGAVAYEATASLQQGKGLTAVETEGMHPLAGIEGEYIEQLMLPLIPGLLYALKDGLTDAETALTEGHVFGVQEAVSSVASKAETFGLKKMEKIAQCVIRATSANDLEATTTLMEDMSNVTKRYIESLEQSYEEYIQGSRSGKV